MSDEALAGPSNVEAPLLNSESDSDHEIIQTQSKRRRKQGRSWVFVKKFSNVQDAENFIKNESLWSFQKVHRTEEGVKRYYRCNKVKWRGFQCSAAIHLLFDAASDEVVLYRTEENHDHNSSESLAARGMSEEARNEIDKLFELKLKPKAIMNALAKKEGINMPSKTQLKNYLAKIREKKYGPSTISLGELKAWLMSHSDMPENDYTAFVISFDVSDDDKNPYFRFVLSTKYLLSLARNCKIIHADATYKLIWQGFPVLIVGTTDRDRSFHPFALSVTSSEQTVDFTFLFMALKDNVFSIYDEYLTPEVLISDAAKSIQIAFSKVFGTDVTIRMCWAHVKKNIQKRVEKSINKSLQKQILSDIDDLQCASSSDVFDRACESFMVKWKDQKEFIKYFSDEWLIMNRNWYLGALPGTPATNNALEAFNRTIKDENTLRERHSLSRFLVLAKDMVTEWSNSYVIGTKSVSQQPTITLKQWTEAFQWAKLPKRLPVTQTTESATYYRIPAGENMECKTFDVDWTSFDDYKEQFFSEWEVIIPKKSDDWLTGTCSCPAFLKQYLCKHLLGLAIRLKYVEPPPEARNIPIGQKRKRGRPTKSKKALLVQ